jgi:hypothetical protein
MQNPTTEEIKKIGKKRYNKFKLQAEAVIENKPIILETKYKTTNHELESGIVIDIETDPMQSQIWCIGYKNNGSVKTFFLDDPYDEDQEKNLLEQAMKEIEQKYEENKELTLYCFSATNFDFRVIDSSLEKFNIDKTIWDSVKKVDLFHEVKKRIMLKH